MSINKPNQSQQLKPKRCRTIFNPDIPPPPRTRGVELKSPLSEHIDNEYKKLRNSILHGTINEVKVWLTAFRILFPHYLKDINYYWMFGKTKNLTNAWYIIQQLEAPNYGSIIYYALGDNNIHLVKFSLILHLKNEKNILLSKCSIENYHEDVIKLISQDSKEIDKFLVANKDNLQKLCEDNDAKAHVAHGTILFCAFRSQNLEIIKLIDYTKISSIDFKIILTFYEINGLKYFCNKYATTDENKKILREKLQTIVLSDLFYLHDDAENLKYVVENLDFEIEALEPALKDIKKEDRKAVIPKLTESKLIRSLIENGQDKILKYVLSLIKFSNTTIINSIPKIINSSSTRNLRYVHLDLVKFLTEEIGIEKKHFDSCKLMLDARYYLDDSKKFNNGFKNFTLAELKEMYAQDLAFQERILSPSDFVRRRYECFITILTEAKMKLIQEFFLNPIRKNFQKPMKLLTADNQVIRKQLPDAVIEYIFSFFGCREIEYQQYSSEDSFWDNIFISGRR